MILAQDNEYYEARAKNVNLAERNAEILARLRDYDWEFSVTAIGQRLR